MLIHDGARPWVSQKNLDALLDALEKIAADLRELSGRMGENIYENVMDGIEIHEKLDAAREERKEQLTELRLQAEELRGRYRELAERSIRDGRRIVRAFPTMQSRRHKELLERIRARVHEGK